MGFIRKFRPKRFHKINSSPASAVTATTITLSTTTAAAASVPWQESVCEVGLDLQDCKADEECVPVQEKSRNGLCKCKPGFTRNHATNLCAANGNKSAESSLLFTSYSETFFAAEVETAVWLCDKKG
jgi:hypothetical protein